jgi:hypothetical protein
MKRRSPTISAAECLLLAEKQKCREQVTMSLNDLYRTLGRRATTTPAIASIELPEW